MPEVIAKVIKVFEIILELLKTLMDPVKITRSRSVVFIRIKKNFFFINFFLLKFTCTIKFWSCVKFIKKKTDFCVFSRGVNRKK